MIGDSNRGYLLELLLTKIRYHDLKNEANRCNGVQIVGMSATLPNLDLLARWLQARLYTTDYRPVPLAEHVKIGNAIYDSKLNKLRSFATRAVKGDSDGVVQLCVETVTAGHSVLVFCPTKKWCEVLADTAAREFYNMLRERTTATDVTGAATAAPPLQLDGRALRDVLEQLRRTPVGVDAILSRTLQYGVAFHHAGLTMDERDIIEGAFRHGQVKVLIATSTLCSGVNLPARRVIIRSPLFNGKLIDMLAYKQMVGRAGRKGVDTEGESILVCKESERAKAQVLLRSQLNPVRSCLVRRHAGDSLSGSMKRAILEVIVSGVASSPGEVERYAACTLLAISLGDEASQTDGAIASCVEFLTESEFIRLQDVDGETRYIPTQFGCAVLASALSPDEAISVFAQLQRARRCFVLSSELHTVYQVVAPSGGMVTAFCNRLGWHNMEMLLDKFQSRLTFGVQRELCELVRLQMLNGQRARMLYDGGFRTVASLAAATPAAVENMLRNSAPFESDKKVEGETEFDVADRKQSRCIWVTGQKGLTEHEAALAIIAEAQQLLSEDVGLLGVCWKPPSHAGDDMRGRFTGRNKKQASLGRFAGRSDKQANLMAIHKRFYGALVLHDLINEIPFGEVCKKYKTTRGVLQSLQQSAATFAGTGRDLDMPLNSGEDVREMGKNPDTPLSCDGDVRGTGRDLDVALNFGMDARGAEGASSELLFCDSPERCLADRITTTRDAATPEAEEDASFSEALFNDSPSPPRSPPSDDTARHHDATLVIADTQLLDLAFSDDSSSAATVAGGDDPTRVETLSRSTLEQLLQGSFYTPAAAGKLSASDGESSATAAAAASPDRSLDLSSGIAAIMDIFGAAGCGEAASAPRRNCGEDGGGSDGDSLVRKLTSPDATSSSSDTDDSDVVQPTPPPPRASGSSVLSPIRGIGEARTPSNRELSSLAAGSGGGLSSEMRAGRRGLGQTVERLTRSAARKLRVEAVATASDAGMRVASLDAAAVATASNAGARVASLDAAAVLSRARASNAGSVDGLDTPVVDDPNVALWLLDPDSKVKNLHELITDYLPMAPKSTSAVAEKCRGMGGLGMQVETRVSGRARAACEALTCLSLMQQLRARLQQHDLMNVFTSIEMPCMKMLSQMELNGMGLCVDTCESVKSVLLAQQAALEEQAHKLAGHRFSLNSLDSIAEICYGIIYGIGPKTLGDQLNVDEKCAATLINTFKSKYEGLRAYLQATVDRCRRDGYVSTMLGRKRYLPNIKSNNPIVHNQAERQAVNTTVQGTAADLVKLAMAAVDRRLTEEFPSSTPHRMSREPSSPPRRRWRPPLPRGAYLLLQLHDELIYEVNEDDLVQVCQIVKQCMEGTTTLSVCLPVNVKNFEITVDSMIGQNSPASTDKRRGTGNVALPRGNSRRNDKRETHAVSIRDSFIPFKGGILISADYSQLELRVIAHLSSDNKLTHILNNGGDVFKLIASEWKMISVDSVTSADRQQAKQICYGIIYGIGPKTLGDQLNVDEKCAATLINTFKSKYEGLRAYLQATVDRCRRDGYVSTMLGRKRYLPNIKSNNPIVHNQAERQAVNTTVQGTAADLVKLAMAAVDRRLTEEFPSSTPHRMSREPSSPPRRRWRPPLPRGAYLLLQLHDELIYEVNEEDLVQVCQIVKQCMEGTTTLSVCLPVNVKVGHTWGSMQSFSL
ncbi:PREDICTED: DNA polymerase theta-like [Priapulus caudatus]|uniref:DNA-directed DNA polymerase n=1 Tax=Priapulus caudatus TaxID=37621 RepID=A0ABM1DQ17_PRICU|nr:PREDICTED: DNA polymerase theta-like [Priapulus caudatus]